MIIIYDVNSKITALYYYSSTHMKELKKNLEETMKNLEGKRKILNILRTVKPGL
jgi:hypothetical protein